MNIREATINDLDKLSVLFDGYRVFYRKDADLIAAKEFIAKRIQQKDSVIYVAINKNEELTGFVQLYPSFSSVRMQRLWILNDLYVESKYRGQGISKMLIDRCKEHCSATNGCGLLLETETSNHIGNQLYLKTDFHLEENNFYFWENNI